MAFASPSPISQEEVARLARAIDLVPGILASIAGAPWDDELSPTMAPDQCEWSWPGAQMGLVWLTDDPVPYSAGGVEAVDMVHLSGEAIYHLEITGYGESLSTRRAALILAMRQLAYTGSALAELRADLQLRPARHESPTSDTGGVTIRLPFTLRIHLSILSDDTED